MCLGGESAGFLHAYGSHTPCMVVGNVGNALYSTEGACAWGTDGGVTWPRDLCTADSYCTAAMVTRATIRQKTCVIAMLTGSKTLTRTFLCIYLVDGRIG